MFKKILGKRLVVSIMTLALSVSFLTSTAFAGDWSPSVGWGAQSGSYSPDFGNTSFYRYVDSYGQLKVSPKARFNFDSNAITAIRNYYNNNNYYYTFDISLTDQYDTTKDAYENFYSTLPNPHFDIDDDPEPFGNGYNDETEVVSLSPTQMVAATDYRFESYFKVLSEANDPEFAFTSQESEYSWVTGEYNTVYFQTHLKRYYPW